MKLGLVGLGRMGAGMAARVLARGHEVVGYDRSAAAAQALARRGGEAADSYGSLVRALAPPRAVWLMVPAAVVDGALAELAPLLARGDTVIDGGNSHFRDDRRRARTLGERGLQFVDAGTSGGVWGEKRGFCLMIGGAEDAVARLAPIFDALAPERGWLRCGESGAGHFVKMVHNAIEYGLMAAYAEGFNLLHRADVGLHPRAADAETAPLADRESYGYPFDLAAIAEVWRHGSVISSWLLDLAAGALRRSPRLDELSGHVADSGEGRWALAAALDEDTPTPILATALFARFSSRGAGDFADRVLSALRREFGGHQERK